MADIISVAVPMLIAILHVFFIVLAIGMPVALWHFSKARQWALLIRWGIVALASIYMAIWGGPDIRRRWKAHVGGEKPAPKITAYIMAGFFAPMLIPEPGRLALKRLRHERGGNRRRRRRSE